MATNSFHRLIMGKQGNLHIFFLSQWGYLVVFFLTEMFIEYSSKFHKTFV